MKKVFLFLLLPILSLLTVAPALAQTVERVKGNAAIINGGEIQLQSGDEFYTIDSMGKKTAWIKVQQIKNNRAVATVLKGTAVAGETLVRKPSSGGASAGDASGGGGTQKVKYSAGFLLGYSMDSISFPASNSASTYTENVSLSGSSFILKGFYDRPLSDRFAFRFMSGLDGFNGTYSAKNTSINKNGSATSSLSLSTLAFEGEIMWNLMHKGLTTFWLGGGYSFQYAMSVSTNIVSLQTSSSYSNSIFAGLGSNIKMGYSSFLPVFVHYNNYLAGSGITQSAITVGAGWGWAF